MNRKFKSFAEAAGGRPTRRRRTVHYATRKRIIQEHEQLECITVRVRGRHYFYQSLADLRALNAAQGRGPCLIIEMGDLWRTVPNTPLPPITPKPCPCKLCALSRHVKHLSKATVQWWRKLLTKSPNEPA